MTYDNNNSGAIWPNKKKLTDKHPKWTGKCTVEGVDYFMSCWAGDKDKPGAPSLTIKFQKADMGFVPVKKGETFDDIPF
jgi:hypothetical protein